MIFVYLRGATAYELQIGRLVIRVCHLQGKRWRFRPWRRINVEIVKPDADSEQ